MDHHSSQQTHLRQDDYDEDARSVLVSPGNYAPSPNTSSLALQRASQLRVQALLRQLLLATNNGLHRPSAGVVTSGDSGDDGAGSENYANNELARRQIDIVRVLRRTLIEMDFKLSWLAQVDLLETIEQILRDDLQNFKSSAATNLKQVNNNNRQRPILISNWRLIHDCIQLLIDAWPKLEHEPDETTIGQLVPIIVQNLGHQRSEVRRVSLLFLNMLIKSKQGNNNNNSKVNNVNNQPKSSSTTNSIDLILRLFVDYGLANYRNEQAQRGAILSLPLLLDEHTVDGQDLLPVIKCLSELLIGSNEHLFYSLYLALQRLHLILGEHQFNQYLSHCKPEAKLLYKQAASRNNSISVNSSANSHHQHQNEPRRRSIVTVNDATSATNQPVAAPATATTTTTNITTTSPIEQQKQVTFEDDQQQQQQHQQQQQQFDTSNSNESSLDLINDDQMTAIENRQSNTGINNNDNQRLISSSCLSSSIESIESIANQLQLDTNLANDNSWMFNNDDDDNVGQVENEVIYGKKPSLSTSLSMSSDAEQHHVKVTSERRQSSVSSTCSSDAHLVDPVHYMTAAALHGKPLANYEAIHHVNHSNVSSLAINDFGPVCNTPTMQFATLPASYTNYANDIAGYVGISAAGVGSGYKMGNMYSSSSSTNELKFGIFPRHLIQVSLYSKNYLDRVEAMQELMCIVRESPINHLAILMTYFDSFLEQFLAKLMQAGVDYKLELIAIDMIETIIIKTKVSAMRYIRPIVALLVRCLADSRAIFRENTIRVMHKMMANLPPQHVIDAIFEHKHHKNALVREESINRVTGAVLEYDRSEFNLTKLCYHVLPMLADGQANVRLASLECIATLANALGSERIGSLLTAAEAVQTGCDYDNLLLDAINARLQRHALPKCNPDGSIRYVLRPFLMGGGTTGSGVAAANGPLPADVRWVLEAPATHQAPSGTSPFYHPSQHQHQHHRHHAHHEQPDPLHHAHRVGAYSPPNQAELQRRRSSVSCLLAGALANGRSPSETGSESDASPAMPGRRRHHAHEHHHQQHRRMRHSGDAAADTMLQADAASNDLRQQTNPPATRADDSSALDGDLARPEVKTQQRPSCRRATGSAEQQHQQQIEHHNTTNIRKESGSTRASQQQTSESQINKVDQAPNDDDNSRQQQNETTTTTTTAACRRQSGTQVRSRPEVVASRCEPPLHHERQTNKAHVMSSRRSNSQDSLSSTDTNKILFQYYLGKFRQSLGDSAAIGAANTSHEQAVLPSDSIIYTDINQAYALSRHKSRQQQTSFDYDSDSVGQVPNPTSVGPVKQQHQQQTTSKSPSISSDKTKRPQSQQIKASAANHVPRQTSSGRQESKETGLSRPSAGSDAGGDSPEPAHQEQSGATSDMQQVQKCASGGLVNYETRRRQLMASSGQSIGGGGGAEPTTGSGEATTENGRPSSRKLHRRTGSVSTTSVLTNVMKDNGDSSANNHDDNEIHHNQQPSRRKSVAAVAPASPTTMTTQAPEVAGGGGGGDSNGHQANRKRVGLIRQSASEAEHEHEREQHHQQQQQHHHQQHELENHKLNEIRRLQSSCSSGTSLASSVGAQNLQNQAGDDREETSVDLKEQQQQQQPRPTRSRRKSRTDTKNTERDACNTPTATSRDIKTQDQQMAAEHQKTDASRRRASRSQPPPLRGDKHRQRQRHQPEADDRKQHVQQMSRSNSRSSVDERDTSQRSLSRQFRPQDASAATALESGGQSRNINQQKIATSTSTLHNQGDINQTAVGLGGTDFRRALSVSPSTATQGAGSVNIRHILENVAQMEGPFVDPQLALKVAMSALDSPCWSTKVEGLLALIRLVTYHEQAISGHVHEIVARTADETKNLRSTVARSAIFALGDYCTKLRRQIIEPELDLMVRALMIKSNENTAFIRDDIKRALSQMVDHMTNWRMANALILHGSSHKSLHVRRMASQFVAQVVERMGAAKCLVGARDISSQVIPAAVRFAQDSSPHTRYFGRQILAKLMQHSAFERLLRRNLAPNLYRNCVGILESVKRRGPGEPPADL